MPGRSSSPARRGRPLVLSFLPTGSAPPPSQLGRRVIAVNLRRAELFAGSVVRIAYLRRVIVSQARLPGPIISVGQRAAAPRGHTLLLRPTWRAAAGAQIANLVISTARDPGDKVKTYDPGDKARISRAGKA